MRKIIFAILIISFSAAVSPARAYESYCYVNAGNQYVTDPYFAEVDLDDTYSGARANGWDIGASVVQNSNSNQTNSFFASSSYSQEFEVMETGNHVINFSYSGSLASN